MHVLIVEDERRLSGYLKRGLEEEGYAIDQAFDGASALTAIAMQSYDLIVLDIMLPEVDGLAVCRELRHRQVRAPVLMLTARDSVEDRVAGLDAGADDYLVKPFALVELLARLRALLRRGADGPVSTVLQVADLCLDTATRRVTRGERVIELTAKEFAILECLMRAPDRVLTRTMIAEHVWNYTVYNHSHDIDVYISTLRRKLDDGAELKLLHTVRGAGYRLTARVVATPR
ncbi:MAG: response regulator transcription factor [Actinobacteria bacterium]|nr:response regulator transcription factor [Actinomycetota bacterium]